MEDNELSLKLRELIRQHKAFSSVQKVKCDLLVGDGSGRKYYRVTPEPACSIRTAILLCSPKGLGPKLSGDTSVSQEQAFAELCQYFPSHGIPVPEFYAASNENDLIFTEDVGNLALFHILKPEAANDKKALERILQHETSDMVTELFKKAILIIKSLQSIPEDKKRICFRRYQAFESYRAEVQEFTDNYLADKPLKASELSQLSKIYDDISETISSFPKTLCLFDYNAHNLFVSEEANLRVLDFQDACLSTPARDLFSLINDRGMNELLGENRHQQLYDFYKQQLNVDAKFDFYYLITALHWDLRVSGRFIKLNQKFATDKYSEWIPSTIRRLSRTLKKLEKEFDSVSDLIEIACRVCPEIRESGK